MSHPASAPLFKPDDRLYLVDGSSYIFRAYHALPPLTRKSDGLPVGAVAGFCNMLWKLSRELQGDKRPTHLAVIFDASGDTFRSTIYPQYKAHRPDPPADLIPQFSLIREATRAFGIAAIEQKGVEADDLIATYARLAEEAGAEVTIVGSDKDLMQLVRGRVVMLDPVKDKRIGADEVFEKFGVFPEKVVDVQALAGDSVDNVPGVPGIGIKTAAQLITEYGDLEALLAQASNIKQDKRRESLITYAEQARISRQLALLKDDVVLQAGHDDLVLDDPDPARLIAFLKGMEFNTLTRRVAAVFDYDAASIEAAPSVAPLAAPSTEPKQVRKPVVEGDDTPQGLAKTRIDAARAEPLRLEGYETLQSIEALERWIEAAFAQGFVAVDTETSALDALQADLVGISLALSPNKACYIPLAHKAEGGDDLFGGGNLLKGQMPLRQALEKLKPLLEDAAVLKIGQNIKYDWHVFARFGIEVQPIDDTMLMSYALDCGLHGHGMDELSQLHLGHKPIAFSEVTGTGRAQVSFERVDLPRATAYAAEDADVTLRLWQLLRQRLVAEGMIGVYETLERPLVEVIARMETRGIRVDRAHLARLSHEFAEKMNVLEAEVAQLVGAPFNLGSPKQLGEVLFETLKLPGGKKTASGQWATGADVLEELAAQGHELPQKVLDWRGLAKLKSTYADALPHHINPQTGRVHTSFSLAATTTGRLSSSEPNVQNIPIRTEEGRRIRQAFIAQEGHSLISADYSQIELRVLAHVADLPSLKRAFATGIDIHAMTASEMFGVPVAGMDPMVRRRAKAINFGIIYGISAFGLANQLGIGREEAGAYIKKYFERFPGIRDYMEATKKTAREKGYVETLFGRRCHVARIDSKNAAERAFAERQAINAPIQGSAADIIRRAMIRMDEALALSGLQTQMLLQVHDELIFEAPMAEAERALPVIRAVMEKACAPAISLSVPLVVDARAASNWDDAH